MAQEASVAVLGALGIEVAETMMQNARKKLVKEGGAPATEVEQEVAKALFDIEVSPSSEIKADVRDIYISGVKEMEVKAGRTALVVQFPFRVWKTVRKIHGRLIRELEKKFSKKHVTFVANRTILDKNFRRKGLKVRPRTRTLTSVHESKMCLTHSLVALPSRRQLGQKYHWKP